MPPSPTPTLPPHILAIYNPIILLGSGAYGNVWRVQQKETGQVWALKKVFDAFRNGVDAQRTYRQIQFLRQLGHPNIIHLNRVLKAQNNKDIFLVFEDMEADLHSVVGTNILLKVHQISIFYQTLRALRYLHSADLIHRDLKPSNILIDSYCRTKVCDFGLVRSVAMDDQNQQEQLILSEQVATKWYRAPQLLLGSRRYGKPVDVWSFGCVVAQLLIGKPIFSGKSPIEQLEKILQLTGQLSVEDMESLGAHNASQLLSQIKFKYKPFDELFSNVDKDFHQLMYQSLRFNPNDRMTITQLLYLPLFKQFHQQIKNETELLPEEAILPRVNDNVRKPVKYYREILYREIDRWEMMEGIDRRGVQVDMDRKRATMSRHPSNQQQHPSTVKNQSQHNQQPQSKSRKKSTQVTQVTQIVPRFSSTHEEKPQVSTNLNKRSTNKHLNQSPYQSPTRNIVNNKIQSKLYNSSNQTKSPKSSKTREIADLSAYQKEEIDEAEGSLEKHYNQQGINKMLTRGLAKQTYSSMSKLFSSKPSKLKSYDNNKNNNSHTNQPNKPPLSSKSKSHTLLSSNEQPLVGSKTAAAIKSKPSYGSSTGFRHHSTGKVRARNVSHNNSGGSNQNIASPMTELRRHSANQLLGVQNNINASHSMSSPYLTEMSKSAGQPQRRHSQKRPILRSHSYHQLGANSQNNPSNSHQYSVANKPRHNSYNPISKQYITYQTKTTNINMNMNMNIEQVNTSNKMVTPEGTSGGLKKKTYKADKRKRVA